MSSSEQAPEPTMDEILASIRKIISDDEPGESPQPEAVASEQVAAPEVAEQAPAEDGLAEDLANALNDTQAGSDDVDDILDLTRIVEDQPPAAEAPGGDALQAAPAEAVAAPEPAPEPQAAQGEADQAVGDIDIASLLAEAGVEDTVVEAPAEPQAPAGEDLSAILEQVEEPAAPAAESAPISEALSSMAPSIDEPVAEAVADAAMPEAAQPESEPVAEASAPVVANEEPPAPEVSEIPEVAEAAAEAPSQAPQEDASFEVPGDVSAEGPQATEPAAEAEVPIEAPAPETPVEDVVAMAAAPEEAAPVEDIAPIEEPAPEAVQSEAAPAEAAGKSLEDSVKDVLRPMLREWMDDNLERIVQDQVASGKIPSQDS